MELNERYFENYAYALGIYQFLIQFTRDKQMEKDYKFLKINYFIFEKDFYLTELLYSANKKQILKYIFDTYTFFNPETRAKFRRYVKNRRYYQVDWE